MLKLTLTTILWAFSFSLIGVYLAGSVDPYFSALIRILLAGLVFLPAIFRRTISERRNLKLMLIGVSQLGFMYLFYYQSFELLSVPEVLVFTTLTPLYVTLINDGFRGHFSPLTLVFAFLAVVGAAIIRWGSINSDFVAGFLLVQLCNCCFALGQVLYRRLEKEKLSQEIGEFGYFYIGALIVSLPTFVLFGNIESVANITAEQWLVLIWLGLGASGIGYFMWNQGAREVDAGTLAIMNNALVPAGLLVNLVIWEQSTDIIKLSIGLGIILLSLLLNSKFNQQVNPTR
jgi:carboxylate/amino acid/amine transporter